MRWTTTTHLLLPLHPHMRVLRDVSHVAFIHRPLMKLWAECAYIHVLSIMVELCSRNVSSGPNSTDDCTYDTEALFVSYPLHVVVVRFLGLDPLQDGLVLVSHSQQIALSSSLIQTGIRFFVK